jgi:hypothetical protein
MSPPTARPDASCGWRRGDSLLQTGFVAAGASGAGTGTCLLNCSIRFLALACASTSNRPFGLNSVTLRKSATARRLQHPCPHAGCGKLAPKTFRSGARYLKEGNAKCATASCAELGFCVLQSRKSQHIYVLLDGGGHAHRGADGGLEGRSASNLLQAAKKQLGQGPIKEPRSVDGRVHRLCIYEFGIERAPVSPKLPRKVDDMCCGARGRGNDRSASKMADHPRRLAPSRPRHVLSVRPDGRVPGIGGADNSTHSASRLCHGAALSRGRPDGVAVRKRSKILGDRLFGDNLHVYIAYLIARPIILENASFPCSIGIYLEYRSCPVRVHSTAFWK